MSKENPKVNWYFSKDTPWQAEYAALREIALDCDLDEVLKWGHPCYAQAGKNVVLIHGFKDYCAFLFFKGALLKDPKKILIQQTPHVQGARQVRFTSVPEIRKLARVLKAYIHEAAAVEKAGLRVPLKKTADFNVPDEFRKALNESPPLKAAFDALTPGRQRGYLFYFGGAKQAKTREARIENYKKQILAGKGMDDE